MNDNACIGICHHCQEAVWAAHSYVQRGSLENENEVEVYHAPCFREVEPKGEHGLMMRKFGWVIFFLLSLSISFPANAQIELKVGDEVKWDCNTCVYKGDDVYSCTALHCKKGNKENDTICFGESEYCVTVKPFKPAPRPGFKLLGKRCFPATGEEYAGVGGQFCYEPDEMDKAIANELRYLRGEIEKHIGRDVHE
ncbi:hypothetical protein LCGC14_2474380 [marine sediment metagenome]|uniref:Uncharacterized protein n=1 Tax=marine sediment metagenome TaxID=412755 RepID=A0A0F9BA76_9ZZZZ